MKRIFVSLWALIAFMGLKAENLTIGSVADLQSVAVAVNGGADYSATVVTLTADLDLTGVNWTPIGTTLHPFTGTFDGQGHTISNLNVNLSGSSTGDVAGLFGQVGTGGMVKDVNISSGRIYISAPSSTGNTCYVGAIAGINESTIVGCSNTALVLGNWDYARVGGIVGKNVGSVQNCYNLGELYTTITNNFVGGVVGNNKGAIQNCFMRSTVTTGRGTSSSKTQAYPIYGNNDGGTISGCFYMNGSAGNMPSPIVLSDGSDNSSVISGNVGGGKNVLLQDRTLYSDGAWNTLCLPFNIPAGAVGYSPIAGAKVMTLESSDFQNSTGTLTLNFEDVTEIEAGKPYIVKWEKPINGDLVNPVFMDVTVSDALQPVETEYTTLTGSFVPVNLEADDRESLYLGADNTLYYPSESVTVNSFRAYFKLIGLTAGDPSGNGVNVISLSFDGETTSIHDIPWPMVNDQWSTDNGQWSMDNGQWFSLDGRKLSGKPTIRGVYIVNGKKVFVK